MPTPSLLACRYMLFQNQPCQRSKQTTVRPSATILATLLLATLVLSTPAWAAQHCYTPQEAREHLGQKVCIEAHVYREINLDDGTRILDLCAPGQTVDCPFAVVSLNRDRKQVGDLHRLIDRQIMILGKVEPIRERTEILLRHKRQILSVLSPEEVAELATEGTTPAKRKHFQANPKLLKSFNASQANAPISGTIFHTSNGY